jgi:hypothetical protein
MGTAEVPMGSAYDHRQIVGTPSVAYAPSGSTHVEGGPLEGNASRQEQLPRGEEAGAAPTLDPQAALAAERLLDCVRQLWEARVNGADDAWGMVKDEGNPDWTVDIVTIGISAALVAAATAVSGGVLAAVVGSVGPVARTVLEEFLTGVGGDLIDAGTTAAVDAVVPVSDGEIVSATISGITEEMLATLSASGQSALELGVPIFVTGTVNDGVIEIGRNERGSMMIRCSGTGDGFLETLDSEGVDREDGAQRLLAWAAGPSLTELQVERDGWF